jgi:hypothetical protein
MEAIVCYFAGLDSRLAFSGRRDCFDSDAGLVYLSGAGKLSNQPEVSSTNSIAVTTRTRIVDDSVLYHSLFGWQAVGAPGLGFTGRIQILRVGDDPHGTAFQLLAI